MPHSNLTQKQAKVLKFIQERVGKNLPPTIREIAQAMGFSSTGTVRDYLNSLKEKGFIKIHAKKARSIELLRKPFIGVPILGKIPAGTPNLATEYLEDYFSLDNIIRDEGIFMLRVKGDSMIDAGIHEDDLALVKKQVTANNNDIVVALIDNDATIKRLVKKNNKFYLQPANNRYKPIEFTKDTTISGKVIAIIRKY
ncbi:MAG: transcriptional repressor LexA [Candidatus Gygaella obscura]|nr:transcriptional repressor LexA [Candidatus Gygaella obscura]